MYHPNSCTVFGKSTCRSDSVQWKCKNAKSRLQTRCLQRWWKTKVDIHLSQYNVCYGCGRIFSQSAEGYHIKCGSRFQKYLFDSFYSVCVYAVSLGYSICQYIVLMNSLQIWFLSGTNRSRLGICISSWPSRVLIEDSICLHLRQFATQSVYKLVALYKTL